MSVVPLTLAISLCLVATFILFFLREHARGGIGGAERDSLLPLAEETPHVATRPQEHATTTTAVAATSGRDRPVTVA